MWDYVKYKLFSKSEVPQRKKISTLPIASCRHYCGFIYGARSFNPYENYVIGVHNNVAWSDLRSQFEDFIKYYRPRNFGDVLGIDISKNIPLWVFPWNAYEKVNIHNGWLSDLDDVPDIITHFCEQGVKRTRINEEYFWLERAYKSIASIGYQPRLHGYIEVLELRVGEDSAYIVTDGNHRLSALAAMDRTSVVVKILPSRIDSRNVDTWFQVKRGLYSKEDAIMTLRAYIEGVKTFCRSQTPAKIIENQ